MIKYFIIYIGQLRSIIVLNIIGSFMDRPKFANNLQFKKQITYYTGVKTIFISFQIRE
jgi:hypothetical protein